ncbi:hypothetical protein T10_9940 [Trichinella papuae]|uniref:Uncharacterized protein n=1 Tax=Trichinella papuae TaxID=268474 RepID=A0A0V1M6T9_9BILA|nr:hypothetical protein T10_9940 [Trichinella papuae]
MLYFLQKTFEIFANVVLEIAAIPLRFRHHVNEPRFAGMPKDAICLLHIFISIYKQEHSETTDDLLPLCVVN